MTQDALLSGPCPGDLSEAVCEQDQLGTEWGLQREGTGQLTRTQLSALVTVLQRGQGRQSLRHVVVKLGQALLLMVLISSRLHCNESHEINPFLWTRPQTLEMVPQTP